MTNEALKWMYSKGVHDGLKHGPIVSRWDPPPLPKELQERTANDEVYEERNKLVQVLTWVYPSGIAKTDIPGWEKEWHNCVYIDLPTGQVSWHYHDREAHLFSRLPPYWGTWDGHTTEEKYKRLSALEIHLEEVEAAHVKE